MIILSAPIEGKLKLFVLRFCKLKLKQLIFSEQFVIVIFFFLSGSPRQLWENLFCFLTAGFIWFPFYFKFGQHKAIYWPENNNNPLSGINTNGVTCLKKERERGKRGRGCSFLCGHCELCYTQPPSLRPLDCSWWTS